MAQEFLIERDPRGYYYGYPIGKPVSTREAGGKTWTNYERPSGPPVTMFTDLKDARAWIRKHKGKLKEVIDLTTWTAEQLPARLPWITKKQAAQIVKDSERHMKSAAKLKDTERVRSSPMRSKIGKGRRM